MTDDIFTSSDTPKEENQEQQNTSSVTPTDPSGEEPSSNSDPLADQLASITNDEGIQKYATVESALKGLAASQEHIAKLQEENRIYRDKVASAKNMEDVLEAIKSNDTLEDTLTQQPLENTLDTNVKEVALNAIMEHEANKTVSQNRDAVSTELTSKFGEKAQEVYHNKAKELNLPVEELTRLAGISPKAVLSHFESTPTTSALPKGSINTTALGQSEDNIPTKYDGLMFGASPETVSKAWKEQADRVLSKYTS